MSPLFKALRVAAVLVLAVAIAGVLLKMRPRAERKPVTDPGRLVEVFRVKSDRVRMVVEAFGTVRPRIRLQLTSEVRGRIVHMDPSFDEGLFVTKGIPLVRIDPRTYRLAVEQRRIEAVQIEAEIKRLEQEIVNLNASLAIARSDVALAQSEFHRLRELSQRKVAAQTTRDKAEQRYLASMDRQQALENQVALTGPTMEQLSARLQMAGVHHRQAQLELDRTRITAPFDGWVLDKSVETGQYVVGGQHLGSLYRHGQYEIDVNIPTEDLKWLPESDKTTGGPDAEILFRAGGTRARWQGRLLRPKAGMDEKTRTLPFIVAVNETAAGAGHSEHFLLRPGMFVTVRILGHDVQGIFRLPRHTVHTGDVVYTVQDSRLRVVPVHITRRFKDSVFVDRGLAEGDPVVSTPLSAAADGMRVRVRE